PRVEPLRLGFEDPLEDLDAASAEGPHPLTVDDRVRVPSGGDHPRDAGADDRFRARWRTAVMVAGFERGEERGASSARGRLFERHDLGVRQARSFVEALADDRA